MLDPENYDAGIEERVMNPHQPFIVISAGEGTAREIAERAAAVLAVGNGVGIDFSAYYEPIGSEIRGTPLGVVIIDEIGGNWPEILPGSKTVAAEILDEFNREMAHVVRDQVEQEMTMLMPERNYRAMHRLLDRTAPQKTQCELEPRQTKPWVERRDWETRNRRRGGRR